MAKFLHFEYVVVLHRLNQNANDLFENLDLRVFIVRVSIQDSSAVGSPKIPKAFDGESENAILCFRLNEREDPRLDRLHG